MKIIHRYILTELVKVFLLSTLFLTLVLFMDKIIYMTDLILNRGVTFFEVMRMILYVSPGFLVLTIPLSVLIAAVVVFNQFSADSEFVVMKASGWSFLYLMRPIIVFSVLAYIVTNAIVFYVLPWGNKAFKKMVYNIVRTRANIDIKPNIFNKDFENLVVFVNGKESNNRLKGLFIANDADQNDSKIILADRGVIVSDSKNYKIHLQLEEGTIHDSAQTGTEYQIIHFDQYDLNLELPTAGKIKDHGLLKSKDMTVADLRQRIAALKKSGQPTNSEEVELSKKFSIPFTCLLFGLVGAPLGIKSSRSGKSGGFVLALFIIIIYYIGLISGQNLGKGGEIPPLIAVWIPNVIIFGLSVHMIYKVQKEIPFTFINKVMDWGERIVERASRIWNRSRPIKDCETHPEL